MFMQIAKLQISLKLLLLLTCSIQCFELCNLALVTVWKLQDKIAWVSATLNG